MVVVSIVGPLNTGPELLVKRNCGINVCEAMPADAAGNVLLINLAKPPEPLG